MCCYVFFQCGECLVHLMAKLGIVQYLSMGVDKRDNYAQPTFLQEGVEILFAKSPAFAYKPFHTVAVNGMVEHSFGGYNHHLTRYVVSSVCHYPLYAERERA